MSRSQGEKRTLGSVRWLGARYGKLWPALSWTIFAIGAAYCVASIMGVTGYLTSPGEVTAGDAWNYWLGQAYTSEHYRYSPAFLWLTAPLRLLGFEAFLAVWTALHLVATAWLGPWTILLAFDDVIRGNVTTFLAVALVFSMRYPALWAATLLTKVTPGVGLLYHVARREWRMLGVALGATAAIVVVGAIIAPGLWFDWFESLAAGTRNYQTIDVLAPLPVRLAAGAVLSLLAVRWLWLLPFGMIIAMPGLWPSSFALLAAVPRLRQWARRGSPVEGEVPS